MRNLIIAATAALFLGEAKAETPDPEVVVAICETMGAAADTDAACIVNRAIVADRASRPTQVVEVERVVEKRVEVQATASVSTSQPVAQQPIAVNPMIGYDAAVGFGSMVQGGLSSGTQLAWKFRNESTEFAYLVYVDLRPVSWQAYGSIANVLVVDQRGQVVNAPLLLPGDAFAVLPAHAVQVKVQKFVKNPTMCSGPSFNQTCAYSYTGQEQTYKIDASQGIPEGHHTYLGRRGWF